jgi:RNA polymerase sigma-70 factor (ECF subfamily)
MLRLARRAGPVMPGAAFVPASLASPPMQAPGDDPPDAARVHDRDAAPPGDSDAALMQAYAHGDEAAFARLFDRHAAAVMRFVRRSLGPRHAGAADDVLQDTWISVARAAERYVPGARFTTWLFTVARSRVIDHLRREEPAAVSLDAGPAAGDEDAPALAETLAADAHLEPLAQLQSRRAAEAFLQALDDLPHEQREAFVLQAEGGLSLEEIAAACGVGLETAKSRLRYARGRLRQRLAAWSPT